MKLITVIEIVLTLGSTAASSLGADALSLDATTTNNTLPQTSTKSSTFIPACLLGCIEQTTRNNENICGSASNVACFCGNITNQLSTATVKQDVLKCFDSVCNKDNKTPNLASQYFEQTCADFFAGKFGSGLLKPATKFPKSRVVSTTTASALVTPYTNSSSISLHVRNSNIAKSLQNRYFRRDNEAESPSGDSQSSTWESFTETSTSSASDITANDATTNDATSASDTTTASDVPTTSESSSENSDFSATTSTTDATPTGSTGVVTTTFGSGDVETITWEGYSSNGFDTAAETGYGSSTALNDSMTGSNDSFTLNTMSGEFGTSAEVTSTSSDDMAGSTLSTITYSNSSLSAKSTASMSSTESTASESNSSSTATTGFAPLSMAHTMITPSLISLALVLGIALLM